MTDKNVIPGHTPTNGAAIPEHVTFNDSILPNAILSYWCPIIRDLQSLSRVDPAVATDDQYYNTSDLEDEGTSLYKYSAISPTSAQPHIAQQMGETRGKPIPKKRFPATQTRFAQDPGNRDESCFCG